VSFSTATPDFDNHDFASALVTSTDCRDPGATVDMTAWILSPVHPSLKNQTHSSPQCENSWNRVLRIGDYFGRTTGSLSRGAKQQLQS
jgi:hypothetical protein